MIIEFSEKFVDDWFGECAKIIVDNIEVGIIIYEINETIKIDRIWINPEYRRQKLGTKIINQLMLTYPKKNLVGLSEPNQQACEFWKSLGAELNRDNADWYIPFIIKGRG